MDDDDEPLHFSRSGSIVIVVPALMKQLGLTVLDKETPGDGSCMFHALLDQIQSHPSLPPYADSHWELRYKIVSEGYDLFIATYLLGRMKSQ